MRARSPILSAEDSQIQLQRREIAEQVFCGKPRAIENLVCPLVNCIGGHTETTPDVLAGMRR